MNNYVALPAPAAIGAGAAVDTSLLAATKTIQSNQAAGIVVVIDIANDAGGTKWTPIYTFKSTGPVTLVVAARWMRARVIAYPGGGAPDVNVGAPAAATLSATLVAPAGNTSGAPVDSSSLYPCKTFQVVGGFEGAIRIDISEDGVDWVQALQFTAAGQFTEVLVSKFLRVTRVGVINTSVTPPVINVCSAPVGTDGGASTDVQAYVYTILGTEVGFGTANVTIPLQHAKPSASYIADAWDGGRVDMTLVEYSTPVSQYGLASFQVAATQAPAIGDKICILITDVTP